jgi:hypothetical protein
MHPKIRGYMVDVQHPAPGFIKCGRRETIQLAMDQSHTSVYLLVYYI